MNEKIKLSIGAACLVIISGFLVFSTLNPGFASWSRKPIADFFMAEGWRQLDATNTVCTIVWEYRGYDTLGEETVLFTAAMGVFALGAGLLSAEKIQDRREKPALSGGGLEA
jgi:multisubunit Na+/H+ antiporter MnhB subunit